MIWLPNDKEDRIQANNIVIQPNIDIKKMIVEFPVTHNDYIKDSSSSTITYWSDDKYASFPAKYTVSDYGYICETDKSRLDSYKERQTQEERYFYHPINLTYDRLELITKDKSLDYDLAWLLFSPYRKLDRNRECQALKIAEKRIETLMATDLDSATFEDIACKMYPEFVVFATKFLESISFEPVENGMSFYTSDQIERARYVLEHCQKENIPIATEAKAEYETLVHYGDSAKSNAKVLSLARRVHNRCNFK